MICEQKNMINEQKKLISELKKLISEHFLILFISIQKLLNQLKFVGLLLIWHNSTQGGFHIVISVVIRVN